MLKYRGQWEHLSAEERLFLLAIAFELPKVNGLQVLCRDVADNAGFDFSKLCEVAYVLERKHLIIVEPGPVMFQLSGDAVTVLLCGGKLHEHQRYEAEHLGATRMYLMAEPTKTPA